MSNAAPLTFWPPPSGQRMHIAMVGRTPFGGAVYVETCAWGWREALRWIRARRADGFSLRELADQDAYARATGRDSSD